LFFVRFSINVLALLAVFLVVWNIQGDNIVLIAIVMAVVLSVINVFIRPAVLLLTLPANLLTFGCLGIVINAVLFYFAARLVHIPVDFWRAALGWLAFSIISASLSQIALSE
jgi:putative membrane protein